MKRNKLYTVNKYNLKLFTGVDRENKNIYDGLTPGQTSQINRINSASPSIPNYFSDIVSSGNTSTNSSKPKKNPTFLGVPMDYTNPAMRGMANSYMGALPNLFKKEAEMYTNNLSSLPAIQSRFNYGSPAGILSVTTPSQFFGKDWRIDLGNWDPAQMSKAAGTPTTTAPTSQEGQSKASFFGNLAGTVGDKVQEIFTKEAIEEGAKEGAKAAGMSAATKAGVGAVAGAASQIASSDMTIDGRRYKRGMFDALDPFYHAGDVTFSGGEKGHIENDVGNVFSDLGVGAFSAGAGMVNPYVMLAGAALKSIGDIINNGWGVAVNDERVGKINESISNMNNYKSVDTLDEITDMDALLNSSGTYKGGVFSKGKARDMEQALARKYSDAYSFGNRARRNNAKNIIDDQINAYLRGWSAYGGPLSFGNDTGALGLMQQNRYFDTIDRRSDALSNNNIPSVQPNFTGIKTYDDGGSLEAAFLDSFGTDPIGAAVRYNQGLERMQAEKEAAAVQAAQEAEYNAMQQRIASLETQNQGLEALLGAQPATPSLPPIPETAPIVETTPAVSAPSRAARSSRRGNSNWTYIEDQLRKSGKFNDVQIEGIKYNLQRESALNHLAVGDGGAAFGLGQWHGSRQPKDRSLAGQTQYLIDTLSNFDGNNHWIGRSNYEGFLNARTPEEAHYYIARGYERPAKRIIDKVKRDSDMSLGRLKAFGGELGTNGTDFTNGLLYIDEGGTHEENPFEGVPLGLDAEGIPNLVEEGETVYNDYVFSDRMNVPGFMYKELGLGGVLKKNGKGMSFADASKKLAQESEQRPNDPISKAGLDAALSKLAEVQETERMKQQAEEYMGLEEYACGGKMKNRYDLGGAMKWLKDTYPSMDEKSVRAVASALDKYIETNKSSFYKTNGLSGGLSNEIDYGLAFNRLNRGGEEGFNNWVKNGLDRRAAFQLTYPMPNKPKNSDLMTDYNRKVKDREAAWASLVGGTTSRTAEPEPESTPIVAKDKAIKYKDNAGNLHATREEAVRANDTARRQRIAAQQQKVKQNTSTTTVEPSAKAASEELAVVSQPQVKKKKASQRSIDQSSNYPVIKDVDVEDVGDMTDEEFNGIVSSPNEVTDEFPELVVDYGDPTVQQQAAEYGLGTYTPMQEGTYGLQQEKVPEYKTWMRYAPAFGAGLMSITDALGLTNKPDYTYADKLETAANKAGYAPHIETQPIGDYLTYNPMDIWYQQNALNAQSRATDRAIRNNATPVGTKNASLLANSYNSQLASGNLYRQALESNLAQKQQVADFNRRTNMFNSQMGLEAAMANARYRQQAANLGLSGLAQAAALRDQIDTRTGAARAANLSNLFTSLGNIGRENFAMNQINASRAAHNGYYGNLRGGVGYTISAKGGKIRKRK